MSGCVCPGNILTYECTVHVMRGAATIWTGSAFQCPSAGNEIALSHNAFLYNRNGQLKYCNGAIVARILSVEDNNLNSQLNVTVTPDTAGKTIECLNYNWTHDILIFTSIVPITG